MSTLALASQLFGPVPFLLAWWKRQATRGEPHELAKIASGAWIACAANLILVVGCAMTDRPSALVPVAYCVLLGVLFERMTLAAFWAMHAGIAAAGAILALPLNIRLGRAWSVQRT